MDHIEKAGKHRRLLGSEALALKAAVVVATREPKTVSTTGDTVCLSDAEVV